MIAEFNIPDYRWSVRNGIFVQFQVMTEDGDCQKVVCQNDFAAPTDNNFCSFVYDKTMGDSLIIGSSCGLQSDITSTFNLRMNCENRARNFEYANVIKPLIPTNIGSCPLKSLSTKQTAKLERIESVMTSVETENANLYEVIVCGDATRKLQVDISVVGTDKYSAFATYVCPDKDCYAGSNPIYGWYENSGTNFNHLTITNLRPTTLYIIVYGRGLFNHLNNYTIGVDIVSIG